MGAGVMNTFLSHYRCRCKGNLESGGAAGGDMWADSALLSRSQAHFRGAALVRERRILHAATAQRREASLMSVVPRKTIIGRDGAPHSREVCSGSLTKSLSRLDFSTSGLRSGGNAEAAWKNAS